MGSARIRDASRINDLSSELPPLLCAQFGHLRVCVVCLLLVRASAALSLVLDAADTQLADGRSFQTLASLGRDADSLSLLFVCVSFRVRAGN